MKIIVLTFLLFITLLSAKELDKVSLQLQWLDQFQFAGYYIAKEKGFYEDVGLDVEIKKYNFNSDVLKDVQNQKTTYGVGYINLVKDKSNGAKIKLLYATFQSSPLVILSTKDSNITSVNDFTGKRLMTNPDLSSSISIHGMISKFNISYKDMILQEHSFDIKDLADHNTDLMISYISNEPYVLKQLGVDVKIFDPKDYGFDFYSDILFTSDDEILHHKKRALKFKKASLRGWKYAFKNIDETVNLIFEKYNTQNKTKSALTYEANELKKLAYYKSKELGSINEYKIKRTYDAYNIMGLTKQKIDFDSFVLDLEKQKKVTIVDYTLIYEVLIGFVLLIIAILLRHRSLDKHNREIAKQKKLYDLIAENSANGILMLDLQSRSYIDSNEQSVKILGYESKKDIIGHPIKILSPKYQEDGVLSCTKLLPLLDACNKGGHEKFEWLFQKKDSSVFWVEIHITSIELDEKQLIHMLWIDIDQKKRALKDLTETKEKLNNLNDSLSQKIEEATEKNRLQDQKMIQQSRQAQMGEMLSMIAHQWRQPLNSISLTSGNLSLQCSLDNIDSEFFQNELDLIGEYTQHLNSTINDFRDFFKNNKLKESVNLNQLINSVLKIIKISIENKNIQILNNTDSDVSFESYPNEIMQVILNIVKNAEDILLDNKIINPVITIETKANSTEIPSLVIRDNAGGIDAGNLEKIFDPYFSTKKAKEGTGLGLYMSKTIIEEHCGGKLEVHNDDNGAVFTITIGL